MSHIPVLLQEILFYFDPKPGDRFIDGTANGGGHLFALAERIAPEGMIIGIEADKNIFDTLQGKISKSEYGKNITAVHGSYANIAEIAKEHKVTPKGILFDLGTSSIQLDQSGRGFSFQKDEPLDMRFDETRQTLRASDIVNHATKDELEKLIKEYGEERFARRIAERIADERKRHPILRTLQLVDVIARAMPAPARRGKIHFATRTFQALRIAVNEELETIRKGIEGAINAGGSGTFIAVISFHSLEDRIVKNMFRDESKSGRLALITKKPLIPNQEEIRINPRSRSAKLRIAQKR